MKKPETLEEKILAVLQLTSRNGTVPQISGGHAFSKASVSTRRRKFWEKAKP